MKKKMVSCAMAVLLLLTVNTPAFAATASAKNAVGSGIHIMLVNTDSAKATLNFSGTRAACSAVVDGKSGTTKITATALLKRVNSNGTTTVKTWSGLSTTSESPYFDSSYYVARGYTYELEIDAKVYRNGTVESISVTDTDYCG
jgi:hypothetical protein